MSAYLRLMAVAAALIALAGCVSGFGGQAPQRYYVLEPPVAAAAGAATPRPATLLVMPTTAASFYETQDIAYSRAPGTRAYYQLHAWAERPGSRITGLLVMRLERAGAFRHVAKASTGVRGEVLLDTHLAEFYHDATSAPGSVRITITAELTDPLRRVFLRRRVFTQTVPVPSYDAPGAVHGFNHGVAAVADEIAAWVETVAPR